MYLKSDKYLCHKHKISKGNTSACVRFFFSFLTRCTVSTKAHRLHRKLIELLSILCDVTPIEAKRSRTCVSDVAKILESFAFMAKKGEKEIRVVHTGKSEVFFRR